MAAESQTGLTLNITIHKSKLQVFVLQSLLRNSKALKLQHTIRLTAKKQRYNTMKAMFEYVGILFQIFYSYFKYICTSYET